MPACRRGSCTRATLPTKSGPSLRPVPGAGREDAPQRRHDLREVFHTLRCIVRSGALEDAAPRLPPVGGRLQADPAVDHRWCLRGDGARPQGTPAPGPRTGPGDPTAAVLDSCTLRSPPESEHCAGYNRAKRKKGSKLHVAVSTPWSTCSPCRSARRTSKTARRWRRSRRPCRRLRASRWS